MAVNLYKSIYTRQVHEESRLQSIIMSDQTSGFQKILAFFWVICLELISDHILTMIKKPLNYLYVLMHANNLCQIYKGGEV